MSVFKVASRYAKSLIDLSNEQNTLDAVNDEMDAIVALIKSNEELQAVLKNPIIKTDKKFVYKYPISRQSKLYHFGFLPYYGD